MLKKEHYECINLMICGYEQQDIAEVLHVTKQTITNWKKREDFQKEYDAAVRKGISYHAGEAIKTMFYLMRNAKQESVRYAAARDILDRAGYKAESNLNLNIERSEKLNDIISQLGGEDISKYE